MNLPSIDKGKAVFLFVRNALIIFVITLLLLAIMEGALRLIFGKPDVNSLQNSPYVFHPVYQVGMKPDFISHFQRSQVNGGENIELKMNSQSYRGPELQAKHDYRIVVYGDSNILGRFTDYAHTYVKQLRDSLLKYYPGKDIETVNAGIGGAGIDQAVLRMNEELPVLAPDLVILQVCSSNDMGDAVRNRLLELNEKQQLVRTGYPVEPDFKLIPKSGFLSFLLNTQLYRMAGKVNARLKGKDTDPDKVMEQLLRSAAAENAIYMEHKKKKFSFFDDHYDIDVSTDPGSASSKAKIRLMEALLKEAQSICRRYHLPLLILIEPAVFDMCSNHLFGPDNLKKYPQYKPENLTQAIESGALANHMQTINLYPLFKESQPERLFFKTSDDHWNDTGQQLAAQYTAEYIFRNGLLIP